MFLLSLKEIRVASKESNINKMHTIDDTKISQNTKDALSKLIKEIREAESLLRAKIDRGEIEDDFFYLEWSFFEEISYFYYNLADNGFHPKIQKEIVNLFNLLENFGAPFTRVELFHILVCTTFPPLEVYSEDPKMDCVTLNDFSYFLLSNVPREDFLCQLKKININKKSLR